MRYHEVCTPRDMSLGVKHGLSTQFPAIRPEATYISVQLADRARVGIAPQAPWQDTKCVTCGLSVRFSDLLISVTAEPPSLSS